MRRTGAANSKRISAPSLDMRLPVSQTAACVRLTMNYLGCFTDVAHPWCPPATLTTATVLGEFIDNFDKPQGLSAVTDERDESDEYVCGTRASEKGESNMARSQEVAVLTIQRGWRWMHKEIELRAANEDRLRMKLREVRYHLVQPLPKGVSAQKTEGLKEIHSTLKDVEKEWRILFNEELVTLEIEFRCRSRDL